jgi:hypothetical protein
VGSWSTLGKRSASSDWARATISTFREFSKLCREENFRAPASVWEFPARNAGNRWRHNHDSGPVVDALDSVGNSDRVAGADFSFASSEFKALGAFSATIPNPSLFVEGHSKKHLYFISIC